MMPPGETQRTPTLLPREAREEEETGNAASLAEWVAVRSGSLTVGDGTSGRGLRCAGDAQAEAVVASSSLSATRLRRSPRPQVPSTSLSPPHTRGRDTREQSGPTRRGEDAARSSAPWPSEPPCTERRVCRYRCGEDFADVLELTPAPH